MRLIIDLLSSARNAEINPKYTCRLLAVIALTAVVVYANTISMGFVWDDIPLIQEPGPIRSLTNIPFFFKNSVTAGLKFRHSTPYYRPMFSLSFALDYFSWGIKPFGYHLTNIILHALVSMLVFLIAVRILGSVLAAFLAGMLFAVHPVHAEAVAYIAARNELLCALFLAASLYAYISYRERSNIFGAIISQLLFFAALLSKEMAVTLPLLICLYELCIRQSGVKNAFKSAVPFAVNVGVYLWLRSSILEISSWEGPPLLERIYTGAGLVASYLRLLVFPFGLKALYDVPIKWNLLQSDVIVPLMVVVVPLMVGTYLYKRDKKLFFGLSWIYAALIPVSGIPALIMPAFMAERYLYIPSIGFSLLCGRLLVLAVRGKGGGEDFRENDDTVPGGGRLGPVITVLALPLLLFAAMAFSHNFAWQDEYTFCKRIIADAPEHPLGYDLLGNYYGRRGENLDMAKQYSISLALIKRQQASLGASYMSKGRYDKAEQAFQQLLSLGYNDEFIHRNLAIIEKVRKEHKD